MTPAILLGIAVVLLGLSGLHHLRMLRMLKRRQDVLVHALRALDRAVGWKTEGPRGGNGLVADGDPYWPEVKP